MTIATTLTASPLPGIGITVTAGSTITAIQLFRTADGVKELTRVQPRTGTTSVYVEDYELPWDVDVVYSATYTASGSHTDTADPVNVSSTSAWAIHPVFPSALSVQIDQPYGSGSVAVLSVGAVSREVPTTLHNIIGSRYPVPVWSGPRYAGTVTMSLFTRTSADEDAVWSLIDEPTPILFRFPDSYGTNFDDGFYAVGKVDCDRLGAAAEQSRQFTLPLTRVAAPAITQQLAWDYPSLTAGFADYAALTAAFADYPSELKNVRTS